MFFFCSYIFRLHSTQRHWINGIHIFKNMPRDKASQVVINTFLNTILHEKEDISELCPHNLTDL